MRNPTMESATSIIANGPRRSLMIYSRLESCRYMEGWQTCQDTHWMLNGIHADVMKSMALNTLALRLLPALPASCCLWSGDWPLWVLMRSACKVGWQWLAALLICYCVWHSLLFFTLQYTVQEDLKQETIFNYVYNYMLTPPESDTSQTTKSIWDMVAIHTSSLAD